jgi:hypothetical protein
VLVISGQHSPQGKQEKILSKRHPAIPCGQNEIIGFQKYPDAGTDPPADSPVLN